MLCLHTKNREKINRFNIYIVLIPKSATFYPVPPYVLKNLTFRWLRYPYSVFCLIMFTNCKLTIELNKTNILCYSYYSPGCHHQVLDQSDLAWQRKLMFSLNTFFGFTVDFMKKSRNPGKHDVFSF